MTLTRRVANFVAGIVTSAAAMYLASIAQGGDPNNYTPAIVGAATYIAGRSAEGAVRKTK